MKHNTPAKILLIPSQLLYLSVSCYLSMMWAFAFFSIPYPEKHIRFPHGLPTTILLVDPLWAYRVNQLLDTIRLGSPTTPADILSCVSYIHNHLCMTYPAI